MVSTKHTMGDTEVPDPGHGSLDGEQTNETRADPLVNAAR